MIAQTLNYTPYFVESGEWIQVLVFGWFIYTKFRRWLQLRTISLGHNYLGLVVLVVLAIGLVLMMKGQQHITLLRVIIYGGLGIEQVFRRKYHSKLSIPEKYLHPVEKPSIEQIPLLAIPYNKLINYLSREPDVDVFWSSASFRNAAIWIMFALLAAFGFSRSVNNYAEGALWAIREQKKTEQEIKQELHKAVTTSMTSATTAFQKVADTLKRGQLGLYLKIDTSARESAKRAADVKAALARTRPTVRTILQFNTPTPKGIQPATFSLPEVREVPPQKPRRKGKYGFYLEDDTDSTFYARYNEN